MSSSPKTRGLSIGIASKLLKEAPPTTTAASWGHTRRRACIDPPAVIAGVFRKAACSASATRVRRRLLLDDARPEWQRHRVARRGARLRPVGGLAARLEQ